MNTEQERADFEAWAIKERIAYRDEKHGVCFYNGERNSYWIGYQAGRAALQSQSMPPEISRGLLGKIVDEVFDGAIEDASVIEDIYRVVARECALQSQDRETCSWSYDESDGAHQTSCGNMHIIIDGTPDDNGMKYCCYCGGRITPRHRPRPPR